MKTTVTEALRIQNEISEMIRTAMGKERYLQYGVTYQDDTVIEERGSRETLPEYLEKIQKFFGLSQQIHSILAKFAVDSGVSDKVRERENLKSVQRTLESALIAMPTETLTQFEVVGNQRVKVVTEFKPFVTKKDLKNRLKKIKTQIRELQVQIDALNAQLIELPFEYEDLETEQE